MVYAKSSGLFSECYCHLSGQYINYKNFLLHFICIDHKTDNKSSVKITAKIGWELNAQYTRERMNIGFLETCTEKG